MPIKLFRRGQYWYLRGTVRGSPVYESTKTSDRRRAEEIRIKREAELLDRSVHGARATATFLEAAVSYLEAGGEGRYLGRYNEHARCWTGLMGYFGRETLSRIDQAVIDKAARVLKPDAKASTLNRHVYTPMAAVLHHAARRGLCEYKAIERPRQPKGRIRWLTPAEADQLLEACAPHLKPLITFLFYTGARISEALYLDWANVDLPRRRVVFLNTKNGTDRGVPLHSRAFVALANLPHSEGAVFRRPNGKPYKRRADGGGQIKTAFRAACRRARINDFRPHDCRHTWATWLYSETRDLRALMELGGWKSMTMVQRYTHVNPDHLRSAIDLLPGRAESVHGRSRGKFRC